MPTPMFKVLAQSLRLGQPPDGASALRVLVEAIEKQSAEIEELRAKLAIASSRIQYAEARLGRILEATEPDLARDEAPPSSHRDPPEAQGVQVPQPAQPQAPPPAPAPGEGGSGSQRPPPLAPQSASPPAMPRAASVRPQSIPHALPIPKAPHMPHGLTNPHTPLAIPQPIPLPQPPAAALAPPGVSPPPGVPKFAQKPPILQDLVDDGGFDELIQTLVINKRDVLQVAAAEAPFPLSRGPERQRANTAGTPFRQPPMQPGAQAPQPMPQPMPQAVAQPMPHAIRQATPQPMPAAEPAQQPRLARPAQDGTKTGIHPHRPSRDAALPSAGVASQRFAEATIDGGPPLLASITDEAEGSDDFTLTDQTARVDLGGLSELELQAASRQRLDHDGD